MSGFFIQPADFSNPNQFEPFFRGEPLHDAGIRFLAAAHPEISPPEFIDDSFDIDGAVLDLYLKHLELSTLINTFSRLQVVCPPVHRTGELLTLNLAAVLVNERRMLMGANIHECVDSIAELHDCNIIVFELARNAFVFT